jgi:hypothetical protein
MCWLLHPCYHSRADLGSDLLWFPTKPLKTIGPHGKPEGNIAHRMNCIVSHEIVLMGGYNAQALASWE